MVNLQVRYLLGYERLGDGKLKMRDGRIAAQGGNADDNRGNANAAVKPPTRFLDIHFLLVGCSSRFYAKGAAR